MTLIQKVASFNFLKEVLYPSTESVFSPGRRTMKCIDTPNFILSERSIDIFFQKASFFLKKFLIPNTNITQTEFIKDYGDKFFYTARRNDTGEVYSWHEL